MNQLIKIKTLFFFVIVLLNISCGGDDDNNNGINIGDGCIASWSVDGVEYSSDLELCIFLDSTLNLSTNLTSNGIFFLQSDPITSIGNYSVDINATTNVVVFLELNDGQRLAASLGSSVNVTELSNSKAKGTFSGNFYDLMDVNLDPVFSVTNGSFSSNF